MQPIKQVWIALEWLVSLGTKFFRVVPLHTAHAVGATLLSQLSLLVAFILPLKVILLLGSNGIPSYFPEFLMTLDRTHLISVLASAAVAFYLSHVLAERLTRTCVERGASLLLARSRKITLFEDQEGIARRAYQRYAAGLAALVFIGLGAAFLLKFYPAFLLFLLAYDLSAFGIALALYAGSSYARSSMERNFSGAVKLAGDIGFLGAFSFIVVDFLWGSPPSVLIGIISLILMRQWMQRTSALVTNIHSLNHQRRLLSALFFHGQALTSHLGARPSDYWKLVQSPRRLSWIEEELRKMAHPDLFVLGAPWYQTRLPGIAAFVVSARRGEGSTERFLVKLFSRGNRAMAQHEATLLAELGDIPAPEFLGASEVNGLQCHVFRGPDAQPIPAGSLKVKARELTARMLGTEPPPGLVDRYSRSRMMLGRRLTPELINRAEIAADGRQQRAVIQQLRERLDQIKEALAHLPLQLSSPGQTGETLALDHEGAIISLHWGRWNLEPIGSGWPVETNESQMLTDAFEQAKVRRRALAHVSRAQVQLAALASEFERLCQLEQFASALEVVPPLLECLSGLHGQHGVQRAASST